MIKKEKKRIRNDILSIIKRINQSEKTWKSQYMAIWICIGHLRNNYQGTSLWEKKINYGLPASKKKYYSYTPNELVNALGPRDGELKFIHLVNIFSLFKSIPKEFREEVPSLEEKGELDLAYETRNCYIHKNNKIDHRLIKAYKKARGESKTDLNEGEDIHKVFKDLFHQIEEWHELIIKISNKINLN